MVLFWLFASAVAAQHVDYRPTAHYAARVDAFEQMADIDSTTIVMLGDSHTEFGGDWSERLGTANIVNRGITGDNTTGIAQRLSQILPHRPKAIFLLCGINDMSHGHKAEVVFSKVRTLIDSIRAAAPQTRLYVQSLLPINESFRRWKRLRGRTNDIPRVNRLLRQYCLEQQIAYVDLFPHFVNSPSNVLLRRYTRDGLHLTPVGYQLWVDCLRPYVEEANAD